MPSMEMVRLVNSGTEATMSALRLARGFTGRDLTIKFEGSYHGHVDSLLVKAGSGIATLGIPDTAGVPRAFADTTVALPFNSIDAVERAFRERGDAIAAVIVEPVAGNMGCIPPAPGFLEALRELCSRHGALLIFDEVMTGFRVAFGGAQALYSIRPDLTTIGKVIGGGLPIAAYGGRADVMAQIAPSGPVYQAGTLSGKPGGYTLTGDTGRVSIPATLQSLLAARIDRLPEHDKETLGTAAVIGKEFGEPLLRAVIAASSRGPAKGLTPRTSRSWSISARARR